MAKIGFIGTGVMGRSMAGHCLKAGHELTVYNRTKSKAEELLGAGAQWAESPSEVARRSEIVITIVGFPKDVEETYLGEEGLVKAASSGSLLIDMTTSRPDLAEKIAKAGSERGIEVLDAPVSGGDAGAREARLSIMVGGTEAAFARALPVFEVMGKTIVHQGPAGSGQFTKMANQIAIAAGMLGISESMHYAMSAGLDPDRVLQSISGGAAGSWSMTNLLPRALKGDFAPGFYVKHFIKDLKIALESAEVLGIRLPGADLACRLYEQLSADGGGEDGTQALFRLYREGKV